MSQPHPPLPAVGPAAPGPHLAAEFDEMIGGAALREPAADLVHRVAGPDASEVDRQAVDLFADRWRRVA
jgi:hypothetical protein